MFGHERLGAYHSAIKFAALATELVASLPQGSAHLADQLRRASISVPLNIAEGSGKQTDTDKKRFYAIARGSAMECAAILDILKVSSLISATSYSDGKE